MKKWTRRVGWVALLLSGMCAAIVIIIASTDTFVKFMHWPIWSFPIIALMMVLPFTFLIATIMSYIIGKSRHFEE